jgi:UDP-glucose 4-epimerase
MHLRNKILLITGGTGSFGNAVLRKFLNTDVQEIRIFSRDEKKQSDMRNLYHDARVKFYLGDVRNYDSVRNAADGAHYIFHAAALKQVPSCEFYPIEAVRTNILGTDNVLAAAEQLTVEKVVVLSTDKAAYPINAMGMSKGLMEKVALSRARNFASHGCTILCTRYGNVMGSRGSVIPLFLKQLREGIPLTITDPRMTRFMMSLDNAVDLVVYAFQNGQPGDLFVQKSPAATLETLVDALKNLLNAENTVKIIGTRHGEKLYETLLTREERARAEDLGDYFRVCADNRGLDYDIYFTEGNLSAGRFEDYHSHNTQRLDKTQLQLILKDLEIVKNAIAGEVIES